MALPPHLSAPAPALAQMHLTAVDSSSSNSRVMGDFRLGLGSSNSSRGVLGDSSSSSSRGVEDCRVGSEGLGHLGLGAGQIMMSMKMTLWMMSSVRCEFALDCFGSWVCMLHGVYKTHKRNQMWV